jgi:hypothetical protein
MRQANIPACLIFTATGFQRRVANKSFFASTLTFAPTVAIALMMSTSARRLMAQPKLLTTPPCTPSSKGTPIKRPSGIVEWQLMFSRIYPRPRRTDDARLARSVIGLFVELGELAEAIRVFERYPKYSAWEAADVFSYLMV